MILSWRGTRLYDSVIRKRWNSFACLFSSLGMNSGSLIDQHMLVSSNIATNTKTVGRISLSSVDIVTGSVARS